MFISENEIGNAGRKRRYAAGTRPEILRLFFVLAVYVRCFDRIVARARPSGMAQVRRRRRGAGEPILYSSVLAYNVVLSFVKLIPLFCRSSPRPQRRGKGPLRQNRRLQRDFRRRPARDDLSSDRRERGRENPREDESGGGGI